jgi:hypothetical protein
MRITKSPRLLPFGFAALALALGATGCDNPDCQPTCNKLYGDSECDLRSPGYTRNDLLRTCTEECEGALEKAGEVRRTYKPYENTPSDETVTLTNDKEAILWMDCIAETDCVLLNEGFCAPVW